MNRQAGDDIAVGLHRLAGIAGDPDGSADHDPDIGKAMQATQYQPRGVAKGVPPAVTREQTDV